MKVPYKFNTFVFACIFLQSYIGSYYIYNKTRGFTSRENLELSGNLASHQNAVNLSILKSVGPQNLFTISRVNSMHTIMIEACF